MAVMAATAVASAAGCRGGAVTPSSPSRMALQPGLASAFDYHGDYPPPPEDIPPAVPFPEVPPPEEPVPAVYPPGPPCGLTYAPSNEDPVLSWRAPIECDPETAGDPPASYIVEVGNSPGETLFSVETADASTSFKGGNEGPIDGRGYARVRARNTAGTSGPSEEIRYDNHGQ